MATDTTSVDLVARGFPAGDNMRAANVSDGYVNALDPKRTVIGTISFEVLTNEVQRFSNIVTKYPVEAGYPITDSIVPESRELQLSGAVSGCVVMQSDPGGGVSRLLDVAEAFRAIMDARQPVDVVTDVFTFRQYAIQNVNLERKGTDGFLYVDVSLIEIRTAGLKTAKVPADVAPKAKNKVGKTKNGGTTTGDQKPIKQTSVLAGMVDKAKQSPNEKQKAVAVETVGGLTQGIANTMNSIASRIKSQ